MQHFKIILCFTVLLVLNGCARNGAVRIDNVPMYGQPEIERPAILQQADEAFIIQASSAFKSREEASMAWFNKGEQYMRQGDLDLAMRRYNQSWLLNPNYFGPYWGFARVMIRQGEIDEALTHISKAKALINDPYQEVALLTDMGVVYSLKALESPESEKHYYFNLANESFQKSINMDPTYPESWRYWAYSRLEQGKCEEARQNATQATKLGNVKISDSFMKSLNEKCSQSSANTEREE